MSNFDTDVLFDLIRAKRECLLRLRDLGRQQQTLIEDGDMTGLLNLLVAKQKPIMQLQRLERALEPFRRQDPERRVWRTPEARTRCADALGQCETLLAEIMRHEKFCEEALVRRRDEAARQLQGAHLAGQARQAYQAGPIPALNQGGMLNAEC
ncbi:MAG: hypothetical protein JXB10_10055 [Pirellulales bacterium]|nr:hypothetical protein [Pirellulales bacterium]